MEQKKGTIEEITFSSKALNEELTLMIYKPANFSPLYKYHLVIAQDGQDYSARTDRPCHRRTLPRRASHRSSRRRAPRGGDAHATHHQG